MNRELGFKVVVFDLGRRTVQTVTYGEDTFRCLLGGRGLAAKILFEEQPRGVDPLGPDNHIIFSTGKLVGAPVPTAGQLTITSKSPATGLYFKSNTGGIWARNLRLAGWDAVVVKGVSARPVFLSIDDDRLGFHDADALWGLGVREASEKIKNLLGGDGWDDATIGQAGEHLVNYACVMTSLYHAGGRGGLGAVMGAKKLKSVVVRGGGVVPVADRDLLRTEIDHVLAKAKESVKAGLLLKFGTAATIEMANEGGSLPVKNFASAQIPGGHKLGGTYLVDHDYMHQGSACSACPMCCHKHARVKDGPYRGHAGGPEYETLASLGTSCCVTDTEAVLKGNELCNDYGLDTISTGGVIGWLMECAEHGLLRDEDYDGLDLTWGRADVMVELIHRIAFRRGIGDLLARGTRLAAEEIGGDAYKFAVQANGLEQSRVDTRVAKAYALSFAINPRGPDHLYAQPQAEFGRTPEARRLMTKIMGSDKYCNSTLLEGKPELVRWHEDIFAASDALGVCSFATTTTYIMDPMSLSNFLKAVWNTSFEPQEIMDAGRRIVILERCFNIRENPDRQDILPWRIMHEPITKGPFKGHVNSPEELRSLLDRYYRIQNYDPKTGRPPKALLRELGLAGQVAGIDELPDLT